MTQCTTRYVLRFKSEYTPYKRGGKLHPTIMSYTVPRAWWSLPTRGEKYKSVFNQNEKVPQKVNAWPMHCCKSTSKVSPSPYLPRVCTLNVNIYATCSCIRICGNHHTKGNNSEKCLSRNHLFTYMFIYQCPKTSTVPA